MLQAFKETKRLDSNQLCHCQQKSKPDSKPRMLDPVYVNHTSLSMSVGFPPDSSLLALALQGIIGALLVHRNAD